MTFDETIAEGDAALVKLKAAALGCQHPGFVTMQLPDGKFILRCNVCGLQKAKPLPRIRPTVADVSKAFGVNLDHLTGFDPEIEDDGISAELISLKAKMDAIEKNPALSKYLPKKFLGSGGSTLDKFGNVIATPVALKHYELKKGGGLKYLGKTDAGAPSNVVSISSPKKISMWKGSPAQVNKNTMAHYDINKDQMLIARIGMASNLNVNIQQAFSASSYEGRKIRLHCRHCNAEKVYFDTEMFQGSEAGLQDEIMDFCVTHSHSTEVKHKLTNVKALPVTAEPEGRRFREED